MLHFATYSDELYKNSRKRILREAVRFQCFDVFHEYTPNDEGLFDDISSNTAYKSVLKQNRGGGYWIWKPYIIKKTMEKMKADDILVYADSGCTLNVEGLERFREYIRIVRTEKPVIRFSMEGLSEESWTTEKIFEHFGVSADERITKTGQINATSVILRKCNESERLIDLWYKTALEYPLLFTDVFNNYKRRPMFRDNRHDQSIFSVISKMNMDSIYVIPDETYPIVKKFPIQATRIRG